MNLGLDGKAYIVSGSSRGIGKGIALALLEEGACVMLTGRDANVLRATHEEFGRHFPNRTAWCEGDLNDASVLRSVGNVAKSTWRSLAGVVANAGAVRAGAAGSTSEEGWNWHFEANFAVARRFIEHFIPDLKSTHGSIVVINSIAGMVDVGAPVPYSAAKAALLAYAASLARSLAPDCIRVNTIAPGNILFPGGNWEKRSSADPEAVRRMLAERVPLKRFGSPREIGDMAAFLLSERSAFLTGACIVVDGGQTAACF